MKLKYIGSILIAGALGSAAHAAPVLLNGDFTQSSYTQNNQFGTGFGGQGVIGWTGNGGYGIYFTSPAAATTVSAISQYSSGKEDLYAVTASPTGGAFVGLDGDVSVRDSIAQTVTGLVAGQSYAVTFSWGAGQLQSVSGATTEQLQVSLGSQTISTAVVKNPSGKFSGWFTETFTYTATASSELLSFLSVGTPSGAPPIAVLDGVSINAVPEPATLALLTVPFAGLALLRRRKFRH